MPGGHQRRGGRRLPGALRLRERHRHRRTRTRPSAWRATCSTSSRCCGTRWCSHCRSSRCAGTTARACASECGARLADDPDHQHDEAIDPRWAALQTLGEATDEEGGRTPGRLQRSEISGCPEAEDVAQQHASPSLAVEGCCALAGDLRQPRLRCEAPAPPRLPRLRSVRRPRRPSPGPLTAPDGRERAVLRRACATALGEPVLDAELLDRALTHRSYAYENGGLPTNERLEFLGDSVLGVVVTDTLYRTHPDLSEGRLAKLRPRSSTPAPSPRSPGPSVWASTSSSAGARSRPAAATSPRSSPTRSRR